ncbi:MAG: hypothetical protein U5R48_06215 [Gammaproteobacteria bacterium]|nr:hypothetical protein [Gammaproteobacteria bacterium]
MSNDLDFYSFFCDDVRVEQDGKLIYLGTIHDGLILHGDPFGPEYDPEEPPGVQQLVFVGVFFTVSGTHDVSLRVEAPSGAIIVSRDLGEADLGPEGKGHAIHAGFRSGFPLPEEGLYRVLWTVSDREFSRFLRVEGGP